MNVRRVVATVGITLSAVACVPPAAPPPTSTTTTTTPATTTTASTSSTTSTTTTTTTSTTTTSTTTTTTTTTTVGGSACWASDAGNPDVWFSGTYGVFGDLVVYSSTDGSCTGEVDTTALFVGSLSDSIAFCNSFGGYSDETHFIVYGYELADPNAWECLH